MFNSWSGGTKHLDFGRSGSGDKMEYVFGGVLVLIIVTAVVFAIISFTSTGSETPLPKEFHMYCLNCKKPLVVTRDQMEKMGQQSYRGTQGNTAGPVVGAGMSASRAQCPDCGKFALIQERQCPNCQKYFHTDDDVRGPGLMSGIRRPDAPPDVCPWCKTNIQQYYKDHPPKR